MKFSIKAQESYSRGELLLRSFFGFIYIGIPHGFMLFFYGLWGAILQMLTFWVILFTGRYPENWFNYQLGLIRWQTRVQVAFMNLRDGNPSFGMNHEDENIVVDIPYQENVSRGSVLIRTLFGAFYVILPHGIALMFVSIGLGICHLAAWFSILFTGKYPESMFNFVEGYLRWNLRVSTYMSFMTHEYPPFSLKE